MAQAAGQASRRPGNEASTTAPRPAPLRIGSRTFDFSRPYVMGVVNATPDSFFDGGLYQDPTAATGRAARLVEEGADIVDVGGESTRPGARPVDADEERRRVLPVIRALRALSDVPISIDTTKVEVARAALDEGADLLNDISGLRFDPGLADLAAERRVPIVLMHSREAPDTMQERIHYDDLLGEVLAEIEASVAVATSRGVPRQSIIVDPGIGFGKTAGHNLEIIACAPLLARLGLPILLGPSNKSFIGAVTGAPVESRTGGTAAAVAAAVLAGVHFVRVHDVATMVQAARIAHAIREAGRRGGQ